MKLNITHGPRPAVYFEDLNIGDAFQWDDEDDSEEYVNVKTSPATFVAFYNDWASTYDIEHTTTTAIRRAKNITLSVEF